LSSPCADAIFLFAKARQKKGEKLDNSPVAEKEMEKEFHFFFKLGERRVGRRSPYSGRFLGRGGGLYPAAGGGLKRMSRKRGGWRPEMLAERRKRKKRITPIVGLQISPIGR